MNGKDTSKHQLDRREALGLIAGGLVAGASLVACSPTSNAAKSSQENTAMTASATTRQPVVYLPHGGGPWPFVEMGLPKAEVTEMSRYLENIAHLPKTQPKAILVISAHWEERVPTLMTSPKPPMFYDYYGFPEESYRLQWPAPGSPELASRVQTLLAAAGIESAVDAQRGFDHGTFVPLMLSYPQANIPTTQLSLKVGLSPREHLEIGRALQPLRDEGVFIIGSGMTYHDMRGFRGGRGEAVSETFDAWLRETLALPANERNRRLETWTSAPMARAAHPREEHLIPLMVAAGAAGEDLGVLDYNGSFMNVRLSGYHFG